MRHLVVNGVVAVRCGVPPAGVIPAEDDEVFTTIRPEITKALEDAVAGGTYDTQQLQQVIRRIVGRWMSNRLRRRPMIIPVVVEA